MICSRYAPILATMNRLLPLLCLAALISCESKHTPSTPVAQLPPMGSIAYLDSTNGLGNFYFGEKLAKKNYLKVVETFPGLGEIAYSPPKDSFIVSGIPVDRLRYVYFKNQLVEIEFGTKDPSAIAALQAVFVKRYGIGTPDTLDADNFDWEGRNVRASFIKTTLYDDLSHFHLADQYFRDSLSFYKRFRDEFVKLHPHGRKKNPQ